MIKNVVFNFPSNGIHVSIGEFELFDMFSLDTCKMPPWYWNTFPTQCYMLPFNNFIQSGNLF